MRGSIVSAGFRKNALFDLGSNINRDNCLYPWWLLRETFRTYGIELNTDDLYHGRETPDFYLHVDATDLDVTGRPSFLLMMETPLTWPDNGRRDLLSRYKQVFTWDDDLVKQIGACKIRYPLYSDPIAPRRWDARNKLCCLIAGNKSANVKDARELYTERVSTIRWFEEHAPGDFDLYGLGWTYPAPGVGRRGRAIAKLAGVFYRAAGASVFPSYRGPVGHKREVLSTHKFCICYENARDIPGYVTEKIFDSFAAGCIPVYWGAPNVSDEIPQDCFVDRRQFRSLADLHTYLSTMSEQKYSEYQERISNFMTGQQISPFLATTFANTIVESIVSRLR